MKIKYLVIFLLGMTLSMTSSAWGNEHYHAGGGYWRGHGGYYGYGPGPGFYPGWGGPNIIINVPAGPPPPLPYVRRCEDVEVCNQFDQCWIERQCY